TGRPVPGDVPRRDRAAGPRGKHGGRRCTRPGYDLICAPVPFREPVMNHIRDAVHADLPAIRDIYNDAVLNTLAIWNEQTVDLGNRQAWFAARQAQGYPI